MEEPRILSISDGLYRMRHQVLGPCPRIQSHIPCSSFYPVSQDTCIGSVSILSRQVSWYRLPADCSVYSRKLPRWPFARPPCPDLFSGQAVYLLLALLRPAVVRSIMISRSSCATAPKSVITNLPWADVVSTNGSLMLLNFTPIFSNCSTSFKRCEILRAILSSFQTIIVSPSLSREIIKSKSWRSALAPEETSRYIFSRRLLPSKVRRSVNWGSGISCLPSHIQIAYPV